MYAFVALVALSQTFGAVTPEWQTDYANALKVAKDSQKAIVVVIGEGTDGWNNLSRSGKLGDEARKLMADKYVCLYVDAKKAENSRLVNDFGATRLPMLVVSDKTGGFQALRQVGAIDEHQLHATLERYVAYEIPQDGIVRQSYYQAGGAAPQPGGAAPAPGSAPAPGGWTSGGYHQGHGYGGGCGSGSYGGGGWSGGHGYRGGCGGGFGGGCGLFSRGSGFGGGFGGFRGGCGFGGGFGGGCR